MNCFQQPLYLPLTVDPSNLSDLSMHRVFHESVSLAVDLRIFEHLKTPQTVEKLANRLGLNEKITRYWLKALVHVGCLTEANSLFCNTELANMYLVADSYLYLGHEFKVQVGDEFARQLAAKLTGSMADKPPEPTWSQERLRQIGVFGLMGSIQSTVKSCALAGSGRLLDLGGGHGFYSIAFAQKYPNLKVMLFDLPHVVELAKGFVRDFSVERQVDFRGGNFLTDDIGSDYDSVLCSNILHSTKRETVLKKVYNALLPGGKIIVKCRIADASDTLENAFTNLFWQVRGGGELFTSADWRRFLTEHGFREVEVKGMYGIYATMVALK
ncbi:MAG: crtF [Firmicutes bacterium]|nr:crtF [Bacillota bacterium]